MATRFTDRNFARLMHLLNVQELGKSAEWERYNVQHAHKDKWIRFCEAVIEGRYDDAFAAANERENPFFDSIREAWTEGEVETYLRRLLREIGITDAEQMRVIVDDRRDLPSYTAVVRGMGAGRGDGDTVDPGGDVDSDDSESDGSLYSTRGSDRGDGDTVDGRAVAAAVDQGGGCGGGFRFHSGEAVLPVPAPSAPPATVVRSRRPPTYAVRNFGEVPTVVAGVAGLVSRLGRRAEERARAEAAAADGAQYSDMSFLARAAAARGCDPETRKQFFEICKAFLDPESSDEDKDLGMGLLSAYFDARDRELSPSFNIEQASRFVIGMLNELETSVPSLGLG